MSGNIVTALLRKQQCGFPIIDCLFYSILFGEQDTTTTSERLEKVGAAERYFTPIHYQKSYVVMPIVRRNHWLLMLITPWHILALNSLPWDDSVQKCEFDLVIGYLDYMCSQNNLENKHCNLPNHVLKVPQQPNTSNNFGVYVILFLKYFMENKELYERDPESFIQTNHDWFTVDEVLKERTEARKYYTEKSWELLKNLKLSEKDPAKETQVRPFLHSSTCLPFNEYKARQINVVTVYMRMKCIQKLSKINSFS